jgi:hypothetical protein
MGEYLDLIKEQKDIDEKNNIMMIKIDGLEWYLKRIDSTHVSMSTSISGLKSGFSVNHIAQLKDRPYYEQVKKWLQGGRWQGQMDFKDN